MTQIIGGHNLGLFDGSYSILNRNDHTGLGTLGHGALSFANISNGNLILQERDIYLPSFGEDFNFYRTYNSRGVASDAQSWRFSMNVSLERHVDHPASGPNVTNYTVIYGDATSLEFVFNASRNLWVSTDGNGAYETLQFRPRNRPAQAEDEYLVTRADRSQYLFDKDFNLLSVTDSNGVKTSFEYQGANLVRILDDSGHVLTLTYSGKRLTKITDETNVVLVQYGYTSNFLTSVTDRYGHVTKYHYNTNNLLDSITLPDTQKVGNVTQTYATRTMSFTYAKVKWDDHPHFETQFDGADEWVLTSITDANGGMTTFEYNFLFGKVMAPNDRDLAFKPSSANHFQGGTTRVVDALGNARAYSNDAAYVAWRVARGYYATYNPNYNPKTQAALIAIQDAQAEVIRSAQAVTYTYDPNGQIVKVRDELGFETAYTYDFAGNLTSVTDANGYGAANSNSDYYKKLRVQLGYNADATLLTALQKSELLAKFTATFTYDSNGNLLTSKDNTGNVTTYTYTAFNQVATLTTAMGHKTTFEYDAKQNLIKRTDALGNIIAYEYDANGNLKKKIVYLDKNDLVTASKQQVTNYGYDAFGNNTQIIDAEGKITERTYDHFGNLILEKDPRGNTTTFVYDADDRLLSTTDPEGHATSFAYDSVGNQIAVTHADGHTITRVYDKNNLLLTTIDPSATAALTRTTQFTYDILGNNTKRTDAEGRTTTYSFDANRRLLDVETTQVQNAANQLVTYHESFVYDGEDNVVTRIDRNGNKTEFMFTANGDLLRRTDANLNVTEYLYDADLRQVQITIGAQLPAVQRRVLAFTYDDEDRLLTEKDALGGIKANTYDATGNIIAMKDENGNTTNFEYDRNNRMLKEIKPAVTVNGSPVVYTVTHKYDANGNEIETTDENGHTIKLFYDRADRLVLVTDANLIQTAYSYDARDNRTMVAVGVTATIDANSHVVISNSSKAQVTTFVYDEFSQIVATTDGVGNALATSDEDVYKAMRVQILGAAKELVASLSVADKAALREQFTDHYVFDRVGNRVSVTDHLDRLTTMQYDGLDRLVSVTEAMSTNVSRTTTYRYDGNDNLVKMMGPQNRVMSMTYDAMDRLVDQTDAGTFVTHHEYDNVGNVVSRTLAFGTADARETKYVYDLNDRLTKETDPLLRSKSYEYDAVGNRRKLIDARLGVTEWVYDALDRNILVKDPLTLETKYEYDGVGNRISMTSPRGGITKITYDPGDRQIEMVDAENRKTTFEYDVLGNVVKQKTAVGTAVEQTMTFVYDAEGHLRETTDADNKKTSSRFDQVYNETEVKDGNGHVTKYAYDALNRRITITDPLLNVTTYEYDAYDNVMKETRPGGRVRSFAYDALDRLITETDPLLNVTTYNYDAVGNQVKITRPGGRFVEFVYNKADQLKEERDAFGNSTKYEYDGNDNVTKVTNARNNSTVYTYDADDRVTEILDAANGVTKYTYDKNGNRIKVVDPRLGATVTYYNQNDEVVLTVDATGFASKMTYDANGNVIQRTDYLTRLAIPVNELVMPTLAGPTRTLKFTYDALNRLVKQEDALGGFTQISYDAVGNRITETDENNHKVTYAYDANDRLVARLTAEGYLTTFEYDVAGNEIKRSAYRNIYSLGPSGAMPTPAQNDMARVTSQTWDLNDRLATQTNAALVTTTFTYDAVGNLTRTVVGSGPAARETTTTYDLVDRITDTKDAAGNVTHFELDAMGNVTKRTEANATTAARSTSYTYDVLDRVATMTDALQNVTKYDYDANGNLTTRTRALGLAEQRVEKFDYDANDRVIAQYNGENEKTTFDYDAVGNRIRITVAPLLTEQRVNSFEYDLNDRLKAEIDGNNVRTEYVYDAVGNITEVIQAKGVAGQERHTLMTYSVDDRLLSVVSPLGYARAYSNDTVHQSWRTAHGYAADATTLTPLQVGAILATQRTSYQLDDLGNRTRITDAAGTVTQNEFDILGRLTTNIVGVGGPDGGIKTVNSYDDFDNVLSSKRSFGNDTDARTTKYEYDKLDRQTKVTDGEGYETSFGYDAFGNLTYVKRGDYTGADATKIASKHPLESWFEYDAMDRLKLTRDGRGNLVESTYDALGNRLTQKTGGIAVGGLDVAHAATLSFKYDDAGRVIERTTGAGGVVKLTYDKAGNQTRKEVLQSGPADATGVWTVESYQYDGNSRIIAKLNSYNVRTEYKFDAVGNQTSIIFGKNTTDERSVSFEYDLDNNKTASIDGESNRTTFEYDAVGNQVKQTDALLRVTRYYYDAYHRLIGKLDARNFFVGMTRDSNGNITQTRAYMTAAAGPVTDSSPMPTPTATNADRIVSAEFDLANRLKTQTSPDGSYKTFEYDSTNKLIKQTQYGAPSLMSNTPALMQAPRVLTWQYDDSGRMVKFTNVDLVTEEYTYDAANNKTSETIKNPTALAGGRTDPDRKTTFQYDLDNRLTKQIFDPSGLNLETTLVYDKAGNVKEKTDANSHTTKSDYDKENRVIKVTNPLSQFISYEYDSVGNLTKATNANGYAVTTKYDKNNRVTSEERASVEVMHWVNGVLTTATVVPTTSKKYDAVGNVVQITDARGFTTSRWYDATNNAIAERNGDGALRRFTYDALGQLITVTQDMQFQTSQVNLATPPSPSSDIRTVTNEYDLGGHVVKTTFSTIAVTTLANTNGATPTSSTSSVTPEERNYYDAFGNMVESVDRNGNHNYAYYDLRGRQIATIDAAGYVIETDWDAQDHVVQQRKYKTKLNGPFSAATKPTAPDSAPVKIDRIYDAAGRLIEEWSPAVKASVGGVVGDYRVVTRYAYDKVGNLIRKALNYATIASNGTRTDTALANQRVEYSFYDDANRRRAVVGADRVLNQFTYDAVGNLTLQKRFFNTVASSFDLATATLTTLLAAVTADTSKDEETTFQYDAANRLIKRTDLMGPGTADDLVNISGYDQEGNTTYRKDPDNYETKTRYDSAAHAVEVLAPNGSRSIIEYDTGGLKVRAYTGGAGSGSAPAAVIVGASAGNGASSPLVITWNQSGSNISSWVAWDTVAHDGTNVPSVAPGLAGGVNGTYAHATNGVGSGNGLSAQIPLTAGGTIYFRIMSRDSGGNLTWTEEKSVFVPPRVQSMAVGTSGNNFTLRVTFDTPITSASLEKADNSTPSNYSVSSNGAKTEFTFTFSGTKTDQFHVNWVYNGTTYTTNNVAFLAASGAHVDAGNLWVTWPLPTTVSGGQSVAVGNGQFMLVNGVLQQDDEYMGSINGTAVTANTSSRVNNTQLNFFPGVAASSTVVYDALYGNLSSSTHSASISWSQRQYATVEFDHYNKNDSDEIVSTTYNIVWHNDPLKTNVSATFLAAEQARIGAGGVKISYRTAQNGVSGFTDTNASANGLTYSSALSLTAGSSYDIKIWYTDVDGNEVIVEWRRVTVPANATLTATTQQTTNGKDNAPAAPADKNLALGTTQTYTGDRSIAVLASETGGQIARTGNSTNLAVTVGTYVGPVHPGTSSVTLTLADTANNTGGTKTTNGLLGKTYYTEIEYNALGIKIASNEDNGLWKKYGVDAIGNVVKVDNYGTQAAEAANLTPVTTFKQYEARNLEIASWGAAVTAGRAVTRTTYDYASRKVKVQDPGNTDAQARLFSYDDVGNTVSTTDALGKSTTMAYNVFGQILATTDASNHVRRKSYDSSGLLIEESIDGITDKRVYTYDAFGRRLTASRGVTNNFSTTSYAYDQRDRVTTVTDGMNGVTRYYYDGRDNRIWIQDANGHWFGSVFDGAGLVTHKYSFQSRWMTSDGVEHTGTAPTTLANAQAAVAGTNSTYAATLRDEVTTYDVFGNKLAETDPAGRQQLYQYGAFGQLLSISGQSTSTVGADNAGTALVTTYTYDRFGNKETEASNYGKSITFTYDLAGKLTLINDTATSTKTTYTYDVAGRRSTEKLEKGSTPSTWHNYTYVYNANGWMTGWSDATSGIGETLDYDNVGNVSKVTGKTSANASYLINTYTYDNANRVLTKAKTGGSTDTFTYDSRGRRATWNDGTTTVTYTYDSNDRVTQATGSDSKNLYWTYDKVGNVTSVKDSTAIVFSTDATTGDYTGVTSGAAKDKHYTFYRYDSNNASWFSRSDNGSDDHGDGYTGNTTHVDQGGRVIRVAVSDGSNPGDVKTYTYSYSYNADGTEHAVSASGSGSVSGSSSSTFNANRQLSRLDLGKGDAEDLTRNETKDFEYDNMGHIVRAFHDPGKDPTTTTSYLYANDLPGGEYTDAASPTLDVGNYSVIRNVPNAYGESGPELPDTQVNDYVVRRGETLQSIASNVYGHPELWFIIAEANGLTGSEQLSAGMRLTIPNSVQYAGYDVETHTLYKEGEIVGSKLPNLKSPPPKDNTCEIIAAIILIVIVAIVAVVVTVLTVGAAAPAAAAALGLTATSVGGILVGIAVGAVIGAAVAFTASVITQGILLGFGLQSEFNWKQVAADTVAGAISGAAGGLGAMIEAANAASVAIKVANVVGQTVLEATGDLSRQLIENDGHFDQVNWVTVGIAGAGGALGAVAAVGVRATKASEKVAADAIDKIDDLTKLEQLATKSKLFKTEALEVGDTVFKTSKFKFKVVEDAASGALIVKRFERMTALPQTKIFDDAGKLTDVVIDNTRTSASTRFAKVFKQKWLDQTQGIRTLFSGRSLKQVIESGTVSGSKVGDVKVVRSFVPKVDDVTGVVTHVAKDTKVFRESYLNTSKFARLTQFFDTAFTKSVKLSDKYKFVKEVEEVAVTFQRGGDTVTGTRRVLNAFTGQKVLRTSWAEKLASTKTLLKGTTLKMVDGFKEVQHLDGTVTLAKEIRVVTRQSIAGTTRGARFVSWAKAAASDAKNAIESAAKKVGGLLKDKAGGFLKDKAKDPAGWEKFYIGTLGGLIPTGGKALYKQFISEEKKKHIDNAASPYQFSKGGSNFARDGAVGMVTELGLGVALSVFFKVWPKRVKTELLYPGPFAVYSHPERSEGKESFVTRGASETFNDTYQRLHIWRLTSWSSAAVDSATQIFSPFDIDRALELITALGQNRLIAGETTRFDARSIVAMSASTAGRVGMNAIPMPILLLNNAAPIARM